MNDLFFSLQPINGYHKVLCTEAIDLNIKRNS